MGHDGQLGAEWGYERSTVIDTVAPAGQAEIGAQEGDLNSVIRDRGLLHTYCLDAFRVHACSKDVIASPRDLQLALSGICVRVGVDPLSEEETAELWYCELNFSEFLTVTTELLTAIHRVAHLDDDVLHDEHITDSILGGMQ